MVGDREEIDGVAQTARAFLSQEFSNKNAKGLPEPASDNELVLSHSAFSTMREAISRIMCSYLSLSMLIEIDGG